MPRVLAVLIVIAIIVYALVDASQSRADRVRLMPRWLWMVAIVLLPGVGALGWYTLGRPRSGGPDGGRRRTIAPDDDPDFLRKL